MAGLPPAGVPGQGAPEPLACETLPLYSIELDGVFAGLEGFRGPPEIEPQNNNPTLLALESQIRANPFDRQTWDTLLAVRTAPTAAAANDARCVETASAAAGQRWSATAAAAGQQQLLSLQRVAASVQQQQRAEPVACYVFLALFICITSDIFPFLSYFFIYY